jgi:hypothetical protein
VDFNNLPPWPAVPIWHRAGFFLAAHGITNVNDIEDGDTEIELSAFPANMFAPVIDIPGHVADEPAVGKGMRIVIGVGTDDEQEVQIKDFQADPALVIILDSPVVLAIPAVPIPGGTEVRMADSPVIYTGDQDAAIYIKAVAHALDDRGGAVNAAAMNLAFETHMADNQEADDFHVPDSLALPGGLDLTAAVAAPPDRVTSDTLILPPFQYFKLVPTAGTFNSVFSLYMIRRSPR